MKESDIIDAYVKIRQMDNTIPDDVLDLMKASAIAAINNQNCQYTRKDLRKAFEDGRLYDADELEIRTVGIDNVFDAWYDKIFRFTK